MSSFGWTNCLRRSQAIRLQLQLCTTQRTRRLARKVAQPVVNVLSPVPEAGITWCWSRGDQGRHVCCAAWQDVCIGGASAQSLSVFRQVVKSRLVSFGLVCQEVRAELHVDLRCTVHESNLRIECVDKRTLPYTAV